MSSNVVTLYQPTFFSGTIEHLVFVFNKEVKNNKQKKSNWPFIVWIMCHKPSHMLHLVMVILCILYLRDNSHFWENLSNVFPTIDTVQAWTQTHFAATLERVSRQTAACRLQKHNIKTGVSSNITVPPCIQEITEKTPPLMMRVRQIISIQKRGERMYTYLSLKSKIAHLHLPHPSNLNY